MQDKPRKGPKRLLGFLLILALVAAVTVGGTLLALKHVLKPHGGMDDAAQSTDFPQVDTADVPDAAPSDSPADEEQMPELDAEAYYASFADVRETIPAKDAKSMRSEKEVAQSFAARGFTDLQIMALDPDDPNGGRVISSSSDDRHPMYTATFVAESGDVWRITEINGAIAAEPVSFSADANWETQYVLAETNYLMGYDPVKNVFYKLIPNGDGMILKTVDLIDAETLSELDAWEVRDL